jgi:hypothetical protein
MSMTTESIDGHDDRHTVSATAAFEPSKMNTSSRPTLRKACDTARLACRPSSV